MPPDDIPAWAEQYAADAFDPWALTVDVVALAADVPAEDLTVLLVDREQPPFEGCEALPGGFVDWKRDEDGRAAAARVMRAKAGRDDLEDLTEVGTYDGQGRDPRQHAGHRDASGGWVSTGVRIVSRAFVGLLSRADRFGKHPDRFGPGAGWRSVYRYLPWEDLRNPARRATARHLHHLLLEWADGSADDGSRRRARVEALFGRGGWNPEDAGARWDLLLEACLVEEAWRDAWGRPLPDRPRMLFGEALAFDHREMLSDALGAVRARLRRDPAAAHALAGETFRLSDLQTVFEAAGGQPLVRSNFRRLVLERGLARPTGTRDLPSGPGKPAEFYHMPPAAREARFVSYLTLPWQRDPDS